MRRMKVMIDTGINVNGPAFLLKYKSDCPGNKVTSKIHRTGTKEYQEILWRKELS
jgi:hypothetical protein